MFAADPNCTPLLIQGAALVGTSVAICVRMTTVQKFLADITVMLGDSSPVLATFAAVFLAIATVSLVADWASKKGNPRQE
jgi:hypothetical protein